MYISMNWIKDFVDLDGLDIREVVNKFTLSCAEVEGVEYKGQNVKGVITARIEQVDSHPKSTKLHLLKVNTGKEIVDVVCGAPNVRVGLITSFACIGAQVGQMSIAKATVAGYESSGMCCSAKELGISDDNAGIMEWEEGTPLGVDIKTLLPIEDIIVEIDNKSLTNRPDMWGHYGIAREIAAITGRKLKPYVVDEQKYQGLEELNVQVKSPSCYRYSAVKIGNVTKHVSPMTMQIRLFYCGQRAIALLADLTNYIMLELGQPMHSFDGNNVQSIIVRDLDKDTEFVTLDGVKRVLPKDTMVIETNKEIGAIAGVMGGSSTQIENSTNSVFLEVANFDAVKVRKTATAIGLRSESSARYEKSLDPEMTMLALKRYILLLKNIDTDAIIISNIKDVYVKKYETITIELDKHYVDKYIGIAIDSEGVLEILTALGFEVSCKNGHFTIIVPSWRATKDISIKADIVEEIARVYGYDNIKSMPSLQPVKPLSVGQDSIREYDVKYALADKYALHEIHSYIWEDKLANDHLLITTPSYLKLVNSLQKDNDDIRSSMLPTIIRALEQNKRYKDNFGLFEIGHCVTGIQNKLAKEEKYLGVGYLFEKNELTNMLYKAKNTIQYLFEYVLGMTVRLEAVIPTEQYLAPINAYSIYSNDMQVGILGMVHPKVQQKIDENKCGIVFELNMSIICMQQSDKITLKGVSKYPVTTLDFTFALPSDQLYARIENVASTFKSELSFETKLVDIFEHQTTNVKSYTLRYYVTSYDHTLSSSEIDQFHKAVIQHFKLAGVHLKDEV